MCVPSKITPFIYFQSFLPTLYLPHSPSPDSYHISAHRQTHFFTPSPPLSHPPLPLTLILPPTLPSPLSGVAMEACEFWSALSDDNDAHAMLQSHLGTLIPSLISRLQLKEEQILQVSTGHFHDVSCRQRLSVYM